MKSEALGILVILIVLAAVGSCVAKSEDIYAGLRENVSNYDTKALQGNKGDGRWIKPIDEVGVYTEHIENRDFLAYLYQRNLDRVKICVDPSIVVGPGVYLLIHTGFGFGENWDELISHIPIAPILSAEKNVTPMEKPPIPPPPIPPPESEWDEVHLYHVVADIDNPSCELVERHINGHLSAKATSNESHPYHIADIDKHGHLSKAIPDESSISLSFVNVTGSLQPNHGAKINLTNVTAYYTGEKGIKVGDNLYGYVKLVIPTKGTQFIDAFSESYYLSKYILPIPGPDFEAIDVSFSPTNPREGEEVNVSAIISYTGPACPCLVPVEFNAYDGVARQIGVNYTTSAPGISEVLINWDTTGFEGNYTIEARIDPDGYFSEINETNNIATGNITILPAKWPRIEIASPENRTYYNSTIPLNYTVTGYRYIISTWYNVDGGNNKTPSCAPPITPMPTPMPYTWFCSDTLTNLSIGHHEVTVYASDIGGSVSSKSVEFEIAFPSIKPISLLPKPTPPPPPLANYSWKVSNVTTGFKYAGSTYTIVSGSYVPKEVETNKEYKAYFYFKRISNYPNLTINYTCPLPLFGLTFCCGPGLDINVTNLADWDLYLHSGIGFIPWPGYDCWMYHLPLIIREKPNINVQFSYNKSRNLTIDELKYGKWSDPVVVNFTVTTPSREILDTGPSANPYPSIYGTHKGTITPNRRINVSKLYTYPCLGTGGHTEYVSIYGHGVNVNSWWTGYNGGWHNITFNSPFTLKAGETYNYTIRTGSYPQIHHNASLLTTNGWINCTQFTDANGKRRKNWIPAIRLE